MSPKLDTRKPNLTRPEDDFTQKDRLDDIEIEFNKVDPNPYDLSYACLLIPRFGNHLLVGDIFSYLHIWLQQICFSYGWKLDYTDVQPAYLHWVMSVAMTDSPARFIRIIRHHTSDRVFEEFPKFRKDNLSTDFWAPGNLILAGRRPHPEPLIKEFIQVTRQHQGYTRWNP